MGGRPGAALPQGRLGYGSHQPPPCSGKAGRGEELPDHQAPERSAAGSAARRGSGWGRAPPGWGRPAWAAAAAPPRQRGEERRRTASRGESGHEAGAARPPGHPGPAAAADRVSAAGSGRCCSPPGPPACSWAAWRGCLGLPGLGLLCPGGEQGPQWLPPAERGTGRSFLLLPARGHSCASWAEPKGSDTLPARWPDDSCFSSALGLSEQHRGGKGSADSLRNLGFARVISRNYWFSRKRGGYETKA